MAKVFDDFVQVNGIDLHYYRTGGGEEGKPTLLLLHGVTDSGECWPLVARDMANDYDVIMPDARGHGRSGGISEGSLYEALAQDAIALIRALHLNRPFVWGHSMGARTTLMVASMLSGANEDGLRAIVLEDPPLHGGESANSAARWQWVYDVKALSDEERKAQCRADNPAWAEEEIQPWSTAKAQFSTEVLMHVDPTIFPWRDYLASVTVPILLLTGDPERGGIVTPETARECESLWQQGTVAHITGTGHNIHRERYTSVLATVRDFLHANG